MIYLLFAILSSTCIAIILRISEPHLESRMLMFTSNYIVCSILSALFFPKGNGCITGSSGLIFAIFIGLVSGVLYLISFLLFQYNISINGVVLASIFMKLGVLIPTIMAITVFGESPSFLQIIGILLSLAAIILINFEKDESGRKVRIIWLIILLLSGGFTDSLANIYDKVGNSTLKDHYLFFTFLVATACALILFIRSRQHVNVKDIMVGLLLGIPNYFSARFLLLSLSEIPAVITYPLYSTLTIITVSLAGLLLFHEKLGMRKITAILLIIISMVCLN